MNSIDSKLVMLLSQDWDLGLLETVSFDMMDPVETEELESLRGRFSIRKSGSE